MKNFTQRIISLGALASLLLPAVTHAAVTIENIGGSLGLGNADLKTTVMNIITFVLGLLGLIAVVMMLYGGFTWMTAGGNEDKVDTAKKIISSAAVGLVIILISWAIVTFVVGSTRNVTGSGL
ncbi:MAG: pilin [bacterium]|nr:pilin [bacterium]